MEPQFWLQRWQQGRTGFHVNHVAPELQRYWPGLALPPGSRVLVPLCGKSLDMIWLAEQGYQVLGIEISPLAVEQFFAAWAQQASASTPAPTAGAAAHAQPPGNGLPAPKLPPDTWTSAAGRHYRSGNIELLCADIFDVDAAILASCTGVYDRAALVALPPAMRSRYVQHVYGQLAAGFRGLLITLDYDQARMDGPPFSVPDAEVQSLYAGLAQAAVLQDQDILAQEPKFQARGVPSLHTRVYGLERT